MSRPLGSKDSKKRIRRIPHKALALLDQKVGEWKVLDYKVIDGSVKLLVNCSCGTTGYRNFETIAYGKSQSCGCKHSEIITKKQIKPNNHSAKQKIYTNYQQGAKKRNLIFNITLDDLVTITTQNCFYCDETPNSLYKTKHTEFLHHGIDRVDNNVGYILSNCVSCCKKCNLLKRDVSTQIILRAAKFLEKNNV